MNGIDVALLIILVAFALRGYWRGFLRESFGVLALIAGVAAALQFTGWGVALVQERLPMPSAGQTGVVFVGIFVVTNLLVNLMGVLLHWLADASPLRPINRLGGALLGVAKGGVVLAIVLLFLQLFPIVQGANAHIEGSAVARPLVGVASDILRLGMRGAPSQSSSRS